MIMDEAHLLAKGSTTHAKLNALMAYTAARKWLVTGTPFSTGLEQLREQAMLLGHWDGGVAVNEMIHGLPRAGWQPTSRWSYSHRRPMDRLPNDEIVDRLRAVMIRQYAPRHPRRPRDGPSQLPYWRTRDLVWRTCDCCMRMDLATDGRQQPLVG